MNKYEIEYIDIDSGIKKVMVVEADSFALTDNDIAAVFYNIVKDDDEKDSNDDISSFFNGEEIKDIVLYLKNVNKVTKIEG